MNYWIVDNADKPSLVDTRHFMKLNLGGVISQEDFHITFINYVKKCGGFFDCYVNCVDDPQLGTEKTLLFRFPSFRKTLQKFLTRNSQKALESPCRIAIDLPGVEYMIVCFQDYYDTLLQIAEEKMSNDNFLRLQEKFENEFLGKYKYVLIDCGELT